MVRLNDLVESALENMRHSLGQKVLMLDTNDEMVAAGTTKHCISCFKDRSQSPGRGTIGTSRAFLASPACAFAVTGELRRPQLKKC